MPYKSQEARREASRESMQKKRKGLTRGVNKEGLTLEGVTKLGITQGVNKEGLTQYHPILEYLVDPIKRDKLERICHSLRQHNVLQEVYFGYRQPLSFDIVEGLLQATS